MLMVAAVAAAVVFVITVFVILVIVLAVEEKWHYASCSSCSGSIYEFRAREHQMSLAAV